jgi:hypothetical protein
MFSQPRGPACRRFYSPASAFLPSQSHRCLALTASRKVAYAIRRADLAPVLAAIVVGLHFLRLAKISDNPVTMSGRCDGALVRRVRDSIPFQLPHSLEQYRNRHSSLVHLRGRYTASSKNRARIHSLTRCIRSREVWISASNNTNASQGCDRLLCSPRCRR